MLVGANAPERAMLCANSKYCDVAMSALLGHISSAVGCGSRMGSGLDRGFSYGKTAVRPPHV